MKRVPGGSGEGSGNGEKLCGSSLAWWEWHSSPSHATYFRSRSFENSEEEFRGFSETIKFLLS